jgi:hypothetical protein
MTVCVSVISANSRIVGMCHRMRAAGDEQFQNFTASDVSPVVAHN